MKKKLLITLLSTLTLVSTCLVGMESKEEKNEQKKLKEIFEKMPDDCTGEIISFLEQRDVFKGLAFASKEFYKVCWDKYRNPITVHVSKPNMPSIVGGEITRNVIKKYQPFFNFFLSFFGWPPHFEETTKSLKTTIDGLLSKNIINKLKIKFSPNTTAEEVKAFLKKFDPIKHKIVGLNLCYCGIINWSDKSLLNLFTKRRNLKYLNLSVTNITTEALKIILTGCSNLESLDFHSCDTINWSDKSLSNLIANPNLKSLNINTTNITDEALEIILIKCLNLENLDLYYCLLINWSDKALLNLFSKLKNLTSLNLSWTNTPKKSLETILSSCCNLEFLDLSYCYKISKEEIDELKKSYPNCEIVYS